MTLLRRLFAARPQDPFAEEPSGHRPAELLPVAIFLAALATLLAGYLFMGRGFAHLGRPPFYVGEIVLFIGLIAIGFAFVRARLYLQPLPIVWLLIGFMVLGALRTLPYVGAFGFDALRDAVLWGYATFALLVYFVVDRAVILRAFRLYGWTVPVFALWLPIAWYLFQGLGASIDPRALGSDIPLVFFKSGDMSVHVVGAIAFLVLGTTTITAVRTFVWRAIVSVPLVWTVFVAGATNRGGLVAAAAGVGAVAVLTHRWRNWVPIVAAPALLVAVVLAPTIVGELRSAVTQNVEPAQSTAPSPPAAAADSAGPNGTSRTESDSLVANPGFEVGTRTNGTIRDWEVIAGVGHIVGGGYTGQNSAWVQSFGGPYSAGITSGKFPIDAGEDVSVSLWVNAIVGEPRLEIFVNWYDDADAQISSVPMTAVNTAGDTTWQEAVGSLSAPPNATQAQLLLWEGVGMAAMGIDEVKVATTQADPAGATPSVITNPGFELGARNEGTIRGWDVIAGTGQIVGGGHRGGRSAWLQSWGGPYSGGITSNLFPVEADDDVSVKLWGKAISGSPRLEIFVNWFDGAGQQISSVPMTALRTRGDPNWQDVTGALTAPAGTSQAQILLWEGVGGAALGIDEVSVAVGDFITPPPVPEGRPATIEQIVENFTSIFTDVPDEGLEGTKRFRIRWWTAIVNYTVFGEHFWTGKGFGVNLADADGFQTNVDGSLRAPHNSHMTVLARMGVPGFVLWLLLQGAFSIGLVWSVFRNRRAGDTHLAAIGGWILAYWVAMMVNTSFDPYLEGPQGGIWFWSLFGLGMVVLRLTPRRVEA